MSYVQPVRADRFSVAGVLAKKKENMFWELVLGNMLLASVGVGMYMVGGVIPWNDVTHSSWPTICRKRSPLLCPKRDTTARL